MIVALSAAAATAAQTTEGSPVSGGVCWRPCEAAGEQYIDLQVWNAQKQSDNVSREKKTALLTRRRMFRGGSFPISRYIVCTEVRVHARVLARRENFSCITAVSALSGSQKLTDYDRDK